MYSWKRNFVGLKHLFSCFSFLKKKRAFHKQTFFTTMLIWGLLLWFSFSALSCSADSLRPWARWVPSLPAQEKAEHGNGNKRSLSPLEEAVRRRTLPERNLWAVQLSWKPSLKVTCFYLIQHRGAPRQTYIQSLHAHKHTSDLQGGIFTLTFGKNMEYFPPEKMYRLYC